MIANVRAVDTLVDRITPATTAADIAKVRAHTRHDDRVPVMTEPYTEWVIGDSFAAGRPDWTGAGALITADVLPYEQRKLWLLNGAHSLLAYAAPSRGHHTVAEAISDRTVGGWVDEWWDEAAVHLALPPEHIDLYRGALVQRFSNARIRHRLAQIAVDGSQKLRVRILPVLRSERAAGRLPTGAARVLGAWVAHLRGHSGPIADPAVNDLVARIGAASTAEATRHAVQALDRSLADDTELVAAVAAAALEFDR